MIGRSLRTAAHTAAFVAAVYPAAAMANDLGTTLERGDAAWARRAEGSEGRQAAAGPIGEAVAAYEAALAVAPDALEARWKLLRALYFLGEHVETDRDRRLEIFLRGRDLGEQGLEQLGGAEALLKLNPEALKASIDNSHTDAAETFFWSAAHWGLWGRTRGKLAAAREGVASKVRDRAAASLALDPEIENGGGHRVLGRLHTEAPRIPFITGWIDRDAAVDHLEACVEISPDDLTSRYYLAEALIEFVPKRRAEGIAMLRDVVGSTPDPRWRVEEHAAINDATVLLERVGD